MSSFVTRKASDRLPRKLTTKDQRVRCRCLDHSGYSCPNWASWEVAVHEDPERGGNRWVRTYMCDQHKDNPNGRW